MAANSPAVERARAARPALRWAIAGFLVLVAANNYADRQMLSILAPTIQRDLHVSEAGYAGILNWFLIAYSVSYLLSGRVVDWLGERRSLAIFVTFWSLANAATAIARTAGQLAVCRFALGFGEAGGWTVGPKVIGRWFSAKEHGVASALLSLGGSVGSTVAPIAVILLAGRYGWGAAFIAAGLAGLGLVAIWLAFYRGRVEEGSFPAADAAAGRSNEAEWRRWTAILSQPVVWSIMLARLLTDPIWYFAQFWLPKYLFTVRNVSQGGLGLVAVVFLAADIGFILGGVASDRLVPRLRSTRRARLVTMLGCAVLLALAPLIALTPSLLVSLALASTVTLAQTAWMTNTNAYAIDVVPQDRLGTAVGFIGMGSAAGGVLMNFVVARLVSAQGYDLCFLIMPLLPLLGLALLWRGGRHGWRSRPREARASRVLPKEEVNR